MKQSCVERVRFSFITRNVSARQYMNLLINFKQIAVLA
jgi:hypothetical protein